MTRNVSAAGLLLFELKKNEVDLNMLDFLEERKFIFERIDTIRAKRVSGNLNTFDVARFRAELLNPKPKDKPSTSYNRNISGRNQGTVEILPKSDQDSFSFVNPHRSIPAYKDHPINNVCSDSDRPRRGRDDRDRDRDRRTRKSDGRDRSRNRDSKTSDRNRNRNRSRDSNRSSRSSWSNNKKWNKSRNDSKSKRKDYRSLDNPADDGQRSPSKERSPSRESERNDPEYRSENEGTVYGPESPAPINSSYNSLTTAVRRRINLNRVTYRRIKEASEVPHIYSPTIPIKNVLLLNSFYNKLKSHKPVVVLDSGADTSLISSDLLFSLEKSRYTRSARNPYKNSRTASGHQLQTLDHLYDVEILCNDTRLKLRDVVVAKNLPEGTNAQILLGWSDIADKKIVYQFSEDPISGARLFEVFMGKNKVKIMGPCPVLDKPSADPSFARLNSFKSDGEINASIQRRDIDIRRSFNCLNLSTEPSKVDAIQNWLQTSHLHQEDEDRPRFPTNVRPRSLDNWSCMIANTTSKNKDESDWRILPIKTDDIIRKCSVKSSEILTMHGLEKKLAAQRKVNTVNEVQIDPEGNVLPEGLEGERMKKRIREILERHKEVFSGDTGDAGHILTTDVEIVDTGQTMTVNTARNMVNNITQAEKDIICQKLDSELASGTLQRAMGRKIKNFLPIFLVPKKNATKEEVIVDASKNRMISNCKTIINNLTKHVASSTDDADKAVRDVVGYTQHGWSFSCDISDAFHCIRLPQHLQPYFAVMHPKLGPCLYSRLVQGWISSPQICRDFFTSILANVGNISRYVDDIMGGGTSFDDLLNTLDSLLGTLKYYNLRLKGNKMTILTKKIPFLGRELVNGTVIPSPHHIEKLSGIKWEKIVKGKDLRPYLGLYQYVSPFLWKSSETLHKLHKAASLDAKEIPWSDNDGELIKAFEKSKELLNNTIPLSPLDRSKDLYLVVDTSQIATGALLLQKNDSDSENPYVVIGIFSRKRSDLENKTPTPSCVGELAGIGSAVAHFKGQIADLNEDRSVIILTDSQSAVHCWKKYLKENHPSSSMRISSFIACMYDVKYTMRFIPNISEEIQLADWFSRTASTDKICPEDCKICNVAKKVTGHTYRRFMSELARIDFMNEFVPPSDHPWYHFDDMSTDKKQVFMNRFSSNMSFAKEKTVHVVGTGDEIRRALAHFRVVRRKDIYPFSGTLQGLLKCQKVLCEWQKLDSTIRNTIDILKKGLHAPTKDAKIRTLVDKFRVKLDDRGILVTNEDDGMDTKSRVVLPIAVVKDVVATVHDSLDHCSVNGLMNAMNKVFHFAGKEYFGKQAPPSIMSAVKGKVNACPGCARIAPNRLSKEPFKVVPIPETIGSVLIMDEFSRQNRKRNPWKFVLVTDALSRFSMIYDYDGHMNTKKFKDILKKIEKDFMATSCARGEECSVEVICDELAVHASAVAQSSIVQGLTVKCKETASMSKNVLPELDGRLSKISRLMRAELADPNVSRSDVAVRTARKYNSLIGAEGYCPMELWRSRTLFGNKNFLVKTQLLREGIARSRRLNRESRDRQRGPCPERAFVPYEEHVTCYSNKVVTPLKKGDIIIPYGKFDKNEMNPLYRICEHPTVKSGVDFDNSVIFTRKVGVKEKSNNIHPFHFSSIYKVIDGNSNECKLFLAEDGSQTPSQNRVQNRFRWLIFSEDSPMDLKKDYRDSFECYDYASGSYASDAYYGFNDTTITRTDDLSCTDSDSTTSDSLSFESVNISDGEESYERISDEVFEEEKPEEDHFHVENDVITETTFCAPEKESLALKRLKDSQSGDLPVISRTRLRTTSRAADKNG